MESFPEFLISHSKISKQNILHSLIEVYKKTPHEAEILLESQCINQDDLLKILLHQGSHGLSFKEAALECHLWSNDLEKEIVMKQKENSHLFLQDLIHKGVLNLKDLSSAIDSYEGHGGSSDQHQQDKSMSHHQDVAASLTPKEIFQKNFMPYEKNIDSHILKGYLDLVSEANILEYTNILTKWQSSHLEPNFSVVHAKAKDCKIAADFVHANISCQIWDYWIETLQRSHELYQTQELPPPLFHKLITSLNMIVELSHHLLSDCNELGWVHEDNKNRWLLLISEA